MKVIGEIVKSPAEPSNTSVLWIDTSIAPNEIKHYESGWKPLGYVPNNLELDTLQVKDITTSEDNLRIGDSTKANINLRNDNIEVTTADTGEVEFSSHNVTFETTGGFGVEAEEGVAIYSDAKIRIQADNDVTINSDRKIRIKGENGSIGTVLQLKGSIPTGNMISADDLEAIGLNLHALFGGEAVRIIDKDGIGYTITQLSAQSVVFSTFSFISSTDSTGPKILKFTQYTVSVVNPDAEVYRVTVDSQE